MSLLRISYVSLYFSPLPHLVSPCELLALPSPSCEEFHSCMDLILLAVKLVPLTFIWSMLPCVLEAAMKQPSLPILSNPTAHLHQEQHRANDSTDRSRRAWQESGVALQPSLSTVNLSQGTRRATHALQMHLRSEGCRRASLCHSRCIQTCLQIRNHVYLFQMRIPIIAPNYSEGVTTKMLLSVQHGIISKHFQHAGKQQKL